jgi:probable F420-dependent oxidoreductase
LGDLVNIGLVLQTDPPASEVVARAKGAEDAGFSHIWTFDSCVLWQEPFVIYPSILAATSRVMVGPMVTNPASRDWSVTASLFATLNDQFGNRMVCGMGRGDSALRVIGRKPVSVRTFAEALSAVKDLAEGREVTLNGTAVRLAWAESSRLPVWGAGYGPQALKVIGERADGFILQVADPEVARWTISSVRKAAEAAGRDPDGLSVCVAAPAYVGDDIAHQRDQMRWFGGMVGNHVADIVARYGESSEVPRALTDYVKGRQGYDYSHHGRVDNPSVDFVSDEIVDRFCFVGPTANHLERLAELASLGVDQFALYLMHDGADETLDAYRTTVIPAASSL